MAAASATINNLCQERRESATAATTAELPLPFNFLLVGEIPLANPFLAFGGMR